MLQIFLPEPSSASKQLILVPLVQEPPLLHTSHDPASPFAGQIMHWVPGTPCVLPGPTENEVACPPQPVPMQPALHVVKVYARALGTAANAARMTEMYFMVIGLKFEDG